MRMLTRWGRVAAVAALMLFWAVAPAVAQGEETKIALYIANDKLNADQKSVLTAKFLKPFTASGIYSVVDRSDIFTKKATIERIKQRDGSVNDKEIYKIGNEAGAKYVCMVDLRKAFGQWNISARLVDVETAKIYLAQGETDIAGELDKADISAAAQTIFDQIHRKSVRSVAQTPQYQAPAPTPTPQYQAPAPTPAPTPTVAVQQPVYQAPTPPPPPQTFVDESGVLNDGRDGKKYKTVVIGGNRWMAVNLNYQSQSGRSWCNNKNYSTCDKYGRLYDWNTAMTVCPTGFHLPSRYEWDYLGETVGGEKKPWPGGGENWYGVGNKLKASNGWDDKKNGSSGNGTDEFGFSALPGGHWEYRYYGNEKREDISFPGSFGYWWSSTKDTVSSSKYNNDYAYNWGMSRENDYVFERSEIKNEKGLSVRCVADGSKGSVTHIRQAPPPPPPPPKPSINYGSFTDPRDKKTYKTVTIDKKTWMAENLNYKKGNSWCYDNNNSNCDKYGRLYDWKTANTVCPKGWHLPSSKERYNFLIVPAGGMEAAGKALKAKSGWEPIAGKSDNSTDDYGFSALPGGCHGCSPYSKDFFGLGSFGYWWYSSEFESKKDPTKAHMTYLISGNDDVPYINEDRKDNNYNKSNGYSVRCVADN